jgi:hypothetical protein
MKLFPSSARASVVPETAEDSGEDISESGREGFTSAERITWTWGPYMERVGILMDVGGFRFTVACPDD